MDAWPSTSFQNPGLDLMDVRRSLRTRAELVYRGCLEHATASAHRRIPPASKVAVMEVTPAVNAAEGERLKRSLVVISENPVA